MTCPYVALTSSPKWPKSTKMQVFAPFARKRAKPLTPGPCAVPHSSSPNKRGKNANKKCTKSRNHVLCCAALQKPVTIIRRSEPALTFFRRYPYRIVLKRLAWRQAEQEP